MQDWPKYIKDFFNEKVPFIKFMGIRVVETSHGYAKIEMPIKEEHGNTYSIAHGGVQAALVDVVIGIALRTLKYKLVTVEVNTTYFKPAKLNTTVYATGTLIKVGRTLMHAKAEIKNDQDEVIAIGKAIYYVTGEDDGVYN